MIRFIDKTLLINYTLKFIDVKTIKKVVHTLYTSSLGQTFIEYCKIMNNLYVNVDR